MEPPNASKGRPGRQKELFKSGFCKMDSPNRDPTDRKNPATKSGL